MAASISLSRRLQWLGLLCSLLLGIIGGGSYYLYERRQSEQALAELHSLVEQRFISVLAQSVWDMDQTNTQQLLDSIGRLQGVNRVELVTTQGLLLRSKPENHSNSEWIRDFPVQSERSGNQAVATLRLHLGQALLLQQLQQRSALLGLIIMACMLLMLQLCRQFVLHRVLRPLDQLLSLLQKDDNTPLPDYGREINAIARQLQRFRQSWQQQLQQQALRVNDLQKQRELLNEMATQRTAELELQSRALQLQARLSRQFQYVTAEQLHDEVQHALRQIGQLLAVDRCYLLLMNEQQHLEQTIEWCAYATMLPNAFHDEEQTLLHLPWLIPQLKQQQQLQISRLSEIPPEGHSERLWLAANGIGSTTLLGLRAENTWLGILGCDTVQKPHDWQDKELLMLQLFGDLLLTLLLRMQSLRQQAIQNQQLQHVRQQLQHQGLYDGLTGLANGKRLQQEKAPLLDESFLLKQPLSVLMLDIDHFHAYNNLLGHLAGDDCLVRIAHTIQAFAQEKSGLAVRIRGDCLLVLLPKADLEQAQAYAETLRQAILELHIPHPESPAASFVSVSIGVCSLDWQHHDTMDNLLDGASQALRMAKLSGRNRCCSASTKAS